MKIFQNIKKIKSTEVRLKCKNKHRTQHYCVIKRLVRASKTHCDSPSPSTHYKPQQTQLYEIW